MLIFAHWQQQLIVFALHYLLKQHSAKRLCALTQHSRTDVWKQSRCKCPNNDPRKPPCEKKDETGGNENTVVS